MATDERELVARVKRYRDMEAFRALVLAHQGRLQSLIRGVVGFHRDSEDLLQETFLKVLRSIDNLRDDARFGPWAGRIAVNLAINHRRSEAGRRETPPEDYDRLQDEAIESRETSDGPFESLQIREMRGRLDRALAGLPEKQRTAFLLFHQTGLSVQEISEATGWKEVTVRSHVFRAVRGLREKLQGYYGTLRE